jgi:hypothetical protein
MWVSGRIQDARGYNMNRIANLGMIFTSPSAVARNIAEDPHWLTPLIIVLAAGFIVAFTTHRYGVEYERAAMEDILRRSGRTDEDIDDMFMTTPRKRFFAGAGAVGAAAVALVIVSAILNGVASVAGGKIGFRKMFAFQTHTALIGALGGLVRVPLVLVKHSIDVRTSIGAFAPSVPLRSPLGTLLNSVDVFAVWGLVALIFGFSVLSGLGTKKSAAIVFGLWAVLIALFVVLAVLRSRFVGGA